MIPDEAVAPVSDETKVATEFAVIKNDVIADVLARVVPLAAAATLFALIGLIATSRDQPARFVPAVLATVCLSMAWREIRRQALSRALQLCLLGVGGAVVFGMALNGGLRAPAWRLVYFVVVVTAWAYGRRGSTTMAIGASTLAAIVFVLERTGLLPAARPAPIAFEFVIALVSTWLVWIAASVPQVRFREALARALTRERQLAEEHARRLRAEDERGALEIQLRHAQKMQAIGTLAGGIAHDFNNILAAVSANLELARADAAAGQPQTESLEAIEQGVVRAIDLVQQILLFSHKDTTPHAVTPLRAIVQEAAGLLRAAMPASIELVVDVSGDVPHVLADGTRLHQVIMNLGTNAWHAIAPAQGRVTIRAMEITTDGSTRFPAGLPAARYAVLSFEDDGRGMDAATRERIFEPFFTTKGIGKGSGLGLAVVHGIVSEHQGAISVESEPGRGAIFRIYLPAIAGPVPATVVAPRVEPARGRGQRIFYVDDEEALLRAGLRNLARWGYEATTFARPEDALAALRADPHAADLVITDHNMPGMSGTELATALIALRADLPIVLVSGHLDAVDHGQMHTLAKPYRAPELAALLERLLPRAQGPA
ncbi:MAG: response regulator [Deltaproteobacteria bacterium]|nr:response regulator [Deltaproteobacteria bacterium]